ncbi:hypothetical protein CFREI_00895 [Corynebacterium freiburgense]|nr:hypothetical protein CFREI_00895 [Corynebacterium freiburgense]
MTHWDAVAVSARSVSNKRSQEIEFASALVSSPFGI